MAEDAQREQVLANGGFSVATMMAKTLGASYALLTGAIGQKYMTLTVMGNRTSAVELLLNIPKKRPVSGLSTNRPKTTLERGHSIARAKWNSLNWFPCWP